MSTENPNYYAIIPAEGRYCANLPANAKLLYGEITALTSKEGYCWASSQYFANLYDVSRQTVSGWIKSLETNEFIRCEIEDNYKRRIFLTGCQENPTQLLQALLIQGRRRNRPHLPHSQKNLRTYWPKKCPATNILRRETR